MTARAAIVGAGPSGFYAADQLLRAGLAVDVFDALPTPFGLVRAGVAPDHPKIKSVTRMFDRTAQHAGFRFFGGVELGADVMAQELLERYHAVVYAVGTPRGNRLGLPGEERPGSVGATEFVAWYNGHPAVRRRGLRSVLYAAKPCAGGRRLAWLAGDRRARRALGAPRARPRVKLVRVPDMQAVAHTSE